MMPKVIVKASRTADIYFAYSTISDGITWVGNRAEAEAMMLRRDGSYVSDDPDKTPRQHARERLARVDENGTSVTWDGPPYYLGWDDPGGICGAVGDEERWVPRRFFGEYVLALVDLDEPRMLAASEPVAGDGGRS